MYTGIGITIYDNTIASQCSVHNIHRELHRFLPYSICDETPEVRDIAFSIQLTTTTVQVRFATYAYMYSAYTQYIYVGTYPKLLYIHIIYCKARVNVSVFVVRTKSF